MNEIRRFQICSNKHETPLVINNRWKFQCCATENKAYRAMQGLYANCMVKAKTL